MQYSSFHIFLCLSLESLRPRTSLLAVCNAPRIHFLGQRIGRGWELLRQSTAGRMGRFLVLSCFMRAPSHNVILYLHLGGRYKKELTFSGTFYLA